MGWEPVKHAAYEKKKNLFCVFIYEVISLAANVGEDNRVNSFKGSTA